MSTVTGLAASFQAVSQSRSNFIRHHLTRENKSAFGYWTGCRMRRRWCNCSVVNCAIPCFSLSVVPLSPSTGPAIDIVTPDLPRCTQTTITETESSHRVCRRDEDAVRECVVECVGEGDGQWKER